jgi:hypothetical protein
VDFVSRDTEITAVIAQYDVPTDRLPFLRIIETLVDPSVKSKGTFTNSALQSEIIEA